MQRRKLILPAILVGLLSFIAGALLLAPTASQAAVPTGPVGAKSAQSKISAELRAEFGNRAEGATMRYIAVLAEQANIQNDIRDWNAKGRFVLDTLKGVANRTQPPVAAFLNSQKRAGNVDKYKSYYIINAFAVWGNLSSVESLAARPEISALDVFPVVTLDETSVQAPARSPDTVEWNVSHIRAPQAWAMGYTGTGITVGSLDTGARYTHEALVRQYRGNLGGGSFDHNYNWWAAVGTSPAPIDEGGASSYHGSHTIGTIVGEDASQTNQIGVAPGAKWIATNGIASLTTDPDVIEAGQWILAPWDLNGLNPDPARRPRISSNSWGYGGSSFSCSSATFFRTVTQAWVAAGIFPSFSAGNAGTTGNRPPAAYPETFETGSITSGWAISSFSSRGPSCFDQRQHPQVVTGGSSVRSVNGGGDTGYSLLSGTSMAQPATAGSVAVILQANPNLTIPEIWYILTSTAVMTPGWGTPPSSTYGWGVVQLDAAVQAALGGATPTRTNTSVAITNTPTRTPTVCPPLAPRVIVGEPASPALIKGATGALGFGAASATNSSSAASAPVATDDPITFVNDDGSSENSIGFGTTTTETAALWLNRFTPPAGSFPVTLESIQIFWPTQSTGTLIGKTARLLVYGDSDGDGDPSDATLLNQQFVSITLQAAFQTYSVNVVAPGPTGDIYVGFEDFWAEPGYVPKLYPAAIDTTPPSRVRSWVVAMGSGDPPDITNLGNNDVIGTIDSFGLPGNWLIRASGNTGGGGGCPATSTPTRTPTNTANTPTRTPTTGTGTATPCPMNFSDVSTTDFFYVPVRYLYCAGVISGYADGTFRPYANTTRGQLTKIVVLAFGIPIYTPPIPTFSDVPPTHTFYQYIETAAYEEIVAGYADGTFRPFNDVTRGQLSKIDVVAAGWPLINPPTPTFSDVPVEHAFYTYIETAFCHGVISGYSDGTFRPFNNATRGQISKIVYESVINTASCD